MRRFVFIAILIISCTTLYFHFLPEKSQYIVAITQIAPHPSLDRIRQGIQDVLKTRAPNVKIEFQNAQGSIASAAHIAQHFIQLKPSVIVPITTPSAQTVYRLAMPIKIPVIFSAISDPVSAGLLKNINQQEKTITGVCDFPDIDQQAALIRQISDQLKISQPIVGIIYNSSESNSLAILEHVRHIFPQHGLKLMEKAINSLTDVSVAARSMEHKVDIFYIPNDNMVVSALDSLIKISSHAHKPVIASDPESVKQGCMAAIAPDQYKIGQQTGRMIITFLQSGQLPLPEKVSMQTFINVEVCKKFGVTLPTSVKNDF